MWAKITTKPTSHKMECMICDDDVKKGDKVIRISQEMYPGTRTGYVCKKHIKGRC